MDAKSHAATVCSGPGIPMSKPFFYRIDVAALFDFATEPEGQGMTLLRFAKELQRGQSEIPFIQQLIDEARNYIEKKKEAGSKGGKAKSSSAKQCYSDALAKSSTPLASSSTEAVTEAVTEDNPNPLSGSSPPDDVPDEIPHTEIIQNLNRICGRQYRVTASTSRLIRARWNEGFRVADFIKVIETMNAEWGRDPKMIQYLRPETLFSNKFQSYLNKPTDAGGYDSEAYQLLMRELKGGH